MADEKKTPTVSVIVARDYWDENEVRVCSGTVVELPVDAAMEGVESGAFKRIPKA